jgi:hypothetical protein
MEISLWNRLALTRLSILSSGLGSSLSIDPRKPGRRPALGRWSGTPSTCPDAGRSIGPRPAHLCRRGKGGLYSAKKGSSATKAKPDWSRKFDDPIPLPRGRQLVTLKEAATYITKLPKAEHEAEEWQAAIEALMLVARGGPTMLARIGVMRALNRHVERVFDPSRKEKHWGRRKLARDRN